MKTTLPISTISYNTEAYLEMMLNKLLKAHKIQFWAYIPHVPEEDERKEHFHVYMEPAERMQTEDLREEFVEIVLGEEKPRACMPFNTSKIFGNWYMYVIHDVDFLLSKGMTRKYHYARKDMLCSDPDYLDEKIRQIDMLNLTPYKKMKEAIEHGDAFEDMIARGNVPLPLINQYKTAWFSIVDVIKHKEETNRNGRKNHEEYADGEQKRTQKYRRMSDGRVLNMETGVVESDWKESEDLEECPFEDE